MTNEYTDQDISLQDVLERVFSKLELPYDAERVAASIMAGVRNEIRAIVDEPQPPQPPAFAVGTRVRVLVNDAPVKAGQEGVIEVEDDLSLHDGKVVYGVKVEGIGGLCDFEPHELEPLPAEPASTLPQEILDLSPEEYKAYSMSKKIAIHERQEAKAVGFTPPYIIDSLLSKGLIEAISGAPFTRYRAVKAEPAPALPEGVTLPDHLLGAVDRKERDGHTVYILGDEIRKREIGVKWPTKRAFPNMELFVNEGVGHTATITIHDDGLDYIIQMLQAIQAERNARKGAQS